MNQTQKLYCIYDPEHQLLFERTIYYGYDIKTNKIVYSSCFTDDLSQAMSDNKEKIEEAYHKVMESDYFCGPNRSNIDISSLEIKELEIDFKLKVNNE